MMFQVDKKFPFFSLEVYFPQKGEVGSLSSGDLSGKWIVLMFYPADFTFVCPTELADLNKFYSEFEKLKAEIVVVSTDTVYTHKAWIETEQLLVDLKYPLASDHNGKLSRQLGIYDEEKGFAQRAIFIIDPDGNLGAVEIVSDAIGRSAKEILRKLKALQFVRSHPGNVCPASWEEGEITLQPSIEKAGKVYKDFETK